MQTEKELLALNLAERMNVLLENYPSGIVFSTSFGQEDQVLTDFIFRNNLPISVFTLDTGRLFTETYELMDKTRAKYQEPIQVFFQIRIRWRNWYLTKAFIAFMNRLKIGKNVVVFVKLFRSNVH